MQSTVVVALDDAAEERAEKWENSTEKRILWMLRMLRMIQRPEMQLDHPSAATRVELRSSKIQKIPASQILPALILLLMLFVQLPIQPQQLVVVIKRSRIWTDPWNVVWVPQDWLTASLQVASKTKVFELNCIKLKHTYIGIYIRNYKFERVCCQLWLLLCLMCYKNPRKSDETRLETEKERNT